MNRLIRLQWGSPISSKSQLIYGNFENIVFEWAPLKLSWFLEYIDDIYDHAN